jgi:hypothetical protein
VRRATSCGSPAKITDALEHKTRTRLRANVFAGAAASRAAGQSTTAPTRNLIRRVGFLDRGDSCCHQRLDLQQNSTSGPRQLRFLHASAYASQVRPLRARAIMNAMSTIGWRDAVAHSAPTRALNLRPDDLMLLCDVGQDVTTGSVQDPR